MFITIKTLWEKGRNKSEISRQTGHDWKTINKIVRQIQKGRKCPEQKERIKKLDPYKEKILEFLEKGLSGVRIHEELFIMGLKSTYFHK